MRDVLSYSSAVVKAGFSPEARVSKGLCESGEGLKRETPKSGNRQGKRSV